MNQPLNESGNKPEEPGATTVWKTVPGYPEFEVTIDGQIRENGGPARIRVAGTGHVYVLRTNSRPSLLVHRAVLMAFDRLPLPGEVCRHLDDNPAHNHRSNLKWGTKKENAEDRVANAPAKNPNWTAERRLLERIKALEESDAELRAQNMRLKATIMNLMADRTAKIGPRVKQDLGL